MTEGRKDASDYMIDAQIMIPDDGFVDRHLKKIKELNEIYRPLQAGEFAEFIVTMHTEKTNRIKVDIGDRCFIRGIKKDFAWVYPAGRKNAIKVPVSSLKRWINAKS